MSFDLTEAQEGLWYAQALDPNNPLFNTGQYIDLTGPLDLDAFRSAHAQAMTEAEALRLRFTSVDGAPRQDLADDIPELELVDLRADASGFETARAEMDRDSATPTDPARDPLARFILFRLSDTHHLWYERIHHLAIDGFGMVLLTNRVGVLYGAALGQKPQPALAPLARALETDAAYRVSDQRADDAAYWRSLGTTLGTPASPAQHSAAPTSDHRFLRTARALPDPIFAALQRRAKALRIGWPDLLTLLSGAYLRRVCTDGDAIFGLPFMARFGSKAARVPCMWMNVLPYAFGIAEVEPLIAALQREAATFAAMRKAGRYRSEQLRRDLGRTRREDRLYGPMINVQPYDIAPPFHGLETRLNILSAGPVDDLTLSYRGDGASSLIVEIDANPGLYDHDTITAHLDRLVVFVERALTAERLAQVPSVTKAEQQRLIFGLNATAHDVEDTTLTALIEARMLATPDAPAVMFGDTTLTYGALDRCSRALAERLVEMGAGPDQLVAIALERSEHLAVALVATLRAGAAYVPLDPTQPTARLAALIEQTAPVALLAEAGIAGAIDALRPADWPTEPRNTPLPVPKPDNLAYVLFTSGSTGAPKGVMIEHSAIVNRLIWMRDQYDFNTTDRILQKTPTTFDVSVWELFLPYLCGGTLVFAPPDAHRDPAAIAQVIREQAISVLHFVPSMLSAFLDAPASAGLTLRQVFCSGEELTPDQRDRFHGRISSELHNLYGPTEAAVDVTFWDAGPQDRSAPLPIGKPVWNTVAYVLDEALRAVPDGVAGRLYLGGRQLARGYLGRDDLTDARFHPDPFRPGERIYDTGDLVRRRPDGALIYLGRTDHQVKIRGMRVELGEIEHAIRALEGVCDTVVLARPGKSDHVRLVGYVVADTTFDAPSVLERLAAALPAHMVPSDIVTLDAFPTTANGKLNRKALPAPAQPASHGAPPLDGLETNIADEFCAILGLSHRPARHDDFFGLGGDSLSALKLLLALEERLGRDVPLGQLFETPSIAGLAAALVARSDARAGLGPIFPLAHGPQDAAPLVVLHPAGGLAWGYRGLAQAIADRSPRTIIGIQSPLFTGADFPASLSDLCRDYADRIEALHPGNTIHLAGWSLGGILAQDLAVELAARGFQIGVTALLDAYPAECWRAEPEPDPATALRALLAIAGQDPDAHPELDTRAKVVAFLKTRSSLLGALPTDALDAVVRLVTQTNRLMRSHDHRPYDGTLLHIRAANDHIGRGLRSDLWAPHCAALETLDLPCLHKDMIAPIQAAQIAQAICDRL